MVLGLIPKLSGPGEYVDANFKADNKRQKSERNLGFSVFIEALLQL
jgi:hypothetical protein